MKMTFAVVFAFMMVIVFSVHVHAVPINGLVGKWTFDGNANDTSFNGNHGTVFGATLTTDRFGNADSAYSFDGVNDYIKADTNNLPTSERTVSLWFNVDTVTNHPGLLGYGGGGPGPPGTSWLMHLNNTSVPGSFTMNSHWNTYKIDYFYDSDPINEWFHWVITTSATGTKLYVNGVEMASNNDFVSNTIITNTDLAFGTLVSTSGIAPYTDPNVNFLDGKLDDIYIYNRALSSSEIVELYQENTIPEPTTIALLGIGLAGLSVAAVRRKWKKKADVKS